jgi:hypothetical protein
VAVQVIVPVTANQRVVAIAPVQGILAHAAIEGVGAAFAINRQVVVATQPVERIVSATAINAVIGVTARQGFIAGITIPDQQDFASQAFKGISRCFDSTHAVLEERVGARSRASRKIGTCRHVGPGDLRQLLNECLPRIALGNITTIEQEVA